MNNSSVPTLQSIGCSLLSILRSGEILPEDWRGSLPRAAVAAMPVGLFFGGIVGAIRSVILSVCATKIAEFVTPVLQKLSEKCPHFASKFVFLRRAIAIVATSTVLGSISYGILGIIMSLAIGHFFQGEQSVTLSDKAIVICL